MDVTELTIFLAWNNKRSNEMKLKTNSLQDKVLIESVR